MPEPSETESIFSRAFQENNQQKLHDVRSITEFKLKEIASRETAFKQLMVKLPSYSNNRYKYQVVPGLYHSQAQVRQQRKEPSTCKKSAQLVLNYSTPGDRVEANEVLLPHTYQFVQPPAPPVVPEIPEGPQKFDCPPEQLKAVVGKVYKLLGGSATVGMVIKKYKNCVAYILGSESLVYYHSGRVYWGGWNGNKEGNGTQLIPGLSLYKGQFCRGRKHGVGTIWLSNYVFSGSWRSGEKFGGVEWVNNRRSIALLKLRPVCAAVIASSAIAQHGTTTAKKASTIYNHYMLKISEWACFILFLLCANFCASRKQVFRNLVCAWLSGSPDRTRCMCHLVLSQSDSTSERRPSPIPTKITDYSWCSLCALQMSKMSPSVSTSTILLYSSQNSLEKRGTSSQRLAISFSLISLQMFRTSFMESGLQGPTNDQLWTPKAYIFTLAFISQIKDKRLTNVFQQSPSWREQPSPSSPLETPMSMQMTSSGNQRLYFKTWGRQMTLSSYLKTIMLTNGFLSLVYLLVILAIPMFLSLRYTRIIQGPAPQPPRPPTMSQSAILKWAKPGFSSHFFLKEPIWQMRQVFSRNSGSQAQSLPCRRIKTCSCSVEVGSTLSSRVSLSLGLILVSFLSWWRESSFIEPVHILESVALLLRRKVRTRGEPQVSSSQVSSIQWWLSGEGRRVGGSRVSWRASWRVRITGQSQGRHQSLNRTLQLLQLRDISEIKKAALCNYNDQLPCRPRGRTTSCTLLLRTSSCSTRTTTNSTSRS